MKTTKQKSYPDPTQPFPINYQWSSGGVICRSHTVAAGRDQAAAEERFFKEQPHVQRAAEDCCSRCHGTGDLCRSCSEPPDNCLCDDPTLMVCPNCGGSGQ